MMFRLKKTIDHHFPDLYEKIERIPEYLSIAFRQATMGRPGPVFLELPPDILFAQTDPTSVKMPRRRTHKTAVHPDAGAQLVHDLFSQLERRTLATDIEQEVL